MAGAPCPLLTPREPLGGPSRRVLQSFSLAGGEGGLLRVGIWGTPTRTHRPRPPPLLSPCLTPFIRRTSKSWSGCRPVSCATPQRPMRPRFWSCPRWPMATSRSAPSTT